MLRMNRRILTIVGIALALSSTAAMADDYPNKPVRIIVPFAPGGINDVAARVVATHLTKRLGKQVIAENKAGAGGAGRLYADRRFDRQRGAPSALQAALRPAQGPRHGVDVRHQSEHACDQ
jgi:tripartite-type tricarboxylate transporter receptor subunit TctC